MSVMPADFEGMTEEELNAMIEQAMSEQGTPSQPEETSEPDIPLEPKCLLYQKFHKHKNKNSMKNRNQRQGNSAFFVYKIKTIYHQCFFALQHLWWNVPKSLKKELLLQKTLFCHDKLVSHH